MRTAIAHRLHRALEQRFPERRLFLRSDSETRFIRLKPETQLIAWTGSGVFVAWTIVATAILLMDSIGAGNFRAQAQRDQLVYEDRLNALSEERDARAAEASAAQARFASALEQVSIMQSELLATEDKRRELATALGVVQDTLRRTMTEREAAQNEVATLVAALETGEVAGGDIITQKELGGTLDMLSDALGQTAEQRDKIAADAEFAISHAEDLELELRLLREKNDEIFGQLEEAMMVSVEPLDDMFRAAGMDPDDVIATVRRGYAGTGGPLTPLSFSTMGVGPDDDTLRANSILNRLDEINLYRVAAEQAPFSMPVTAAFRWTSSFGPRWGRAHEGVDLAGPIGTPIYATADGVVIQAGWASGYGRLIKIQHEFGIETRYAHLNDFNVRVGQRVSRGDHIGDMGNSGRSTGPHLHYEIRVGGSAVNPMTFIRAGNDVF